MHGVDIPGEDIGALPLSLARKLLYDDPNRHLQELGQVGTDGVIVIHLCTPLQCWQPLCLLVSPAADVNRAAERPGNTFKTRRSATRKAAWSGPS